jgi:hypothetical protein
MFLAKFSEVNSTKFSTDKNGNMPFIGEVLAGKATGTIYNGTMFKRDGLEINKAYLCDNYVDEEYSNNVQVRIISLVSTTELVELSTQLGKATTVVAKATE